MIRIALDAMGGDKAPQAVVDGAVEAARKSDSRYEIVLVGDEQKIKKALETHYFIKDLPLSVIHASQQIGMDEAPGQALRRKPDSSIAVATQLHKEDKVDALVSAGNTGAVMAAALFKLKTIHGVLRPTLGAFMPHESGSCFLADVGTNLDCKPVHLAQFGIMGSILVTHLMGIDRPRVGLLNVGKEPGKGGELYQKTYELLKKSRLNFIGNVEGRDIMRGRADVILCDGFTGNVLIKFGEGLARMIAMMLKRKIGGDIFGTVGHLLLRPKFRKLVKLFDYQEYGGAPLLGVKGTCIVAHGSSGSRGIRNAIREAWKMTRENIAGHIESQIKELMHDS